MPNTSRLAAAFVAALFLAFALGCLNPGQAGPVAPGGGSISGHAYYRGGSDHSGIVISAEPLDASGRSLALREAMRGGTAGERGLAGQAVTGASGEYRLQGLAAGTYTVYASSPDSLEKAVYTGVSVLDGREVGAADLRLTATGSISGRARLGSAAAGNLGILVYLAGTSYCAFTRDDGAYTLDAVPAGSGYLLVAAMEGYDSSPPQTLEVRGGSCCAAEGIELARKGGAALAGSVSGSASLSDREDSAGIFVYLLGTPFLAMTDATGSYSLAGVAPGSYTLLAHKQGYEDATCPVAVRAGVATSTAALSLDPTGELGLAVRYLRNGASSGSAPFDPSLYEKGERVSVMGNTGGLEKAGLLAMGWNTRADGGGTTYLPGEALTMGSTPLHLYARWSTPASYCAFAMKLETGTSVGPGYWRDGAWVDLPSLPDAKGGGGNSLCLSGCDVYVPGSQTDSMYVSSPGYWKNAVWVSLPLLPSSSQGSAFLIAIAGSDVFVAGEQEDGQGGTSLGYWKNGAWTGLSLLPGTTGGALYGLALSSGDVYQLAVQFNEAGGYQSGYWKNGSWVGLPLLATSAYGDAYNLIIEGGDVFVQGTQLDANGRGSPGYWKNASWVGLPLLSSSTGGWVNGLVVAEGSVSASGVQVDAGGRNSPGLWKDGSWTGLPCLSASTGGCAYNIAQSGACTFIAGTLNDSYGDCRPGYWKDSVWVGLPLLPGSISGDVWDLRLAGGDVYASGFQSNGNGDIPGYWLDGTWMGLPMPPATTSCTVSAMMLF